jgi:hypothetical protein
MIDSGRQPDATASIPLAVLELPQDEGHCTCSNPPGELRHRRLGSYRCDDVTALNCSGYKR